jgi:hypothetical protein
MFWAKTRQTLARLAITATALALPVAAMAGVVVKSTGPSSAKFPVGTKLDDNATITLKGGDVVTVLTAEGTRVIKGAGTFKVGERPQVAADRFASLTRKRAATRVRTGAVRDVNEAVPTNPSLWYADVTRSGTICLYDLATVRLWRPGTGGISTYRIADQTGTASAEVTFDDLYDVGTVDPARLSVTEGGNYLISAPDGTVTAQVTFVSLGEDYAAPDALAEALIAKGCTVQLEALATSLEASAEASDG